MKIILEDISDGQENYKIPLINDIDSEGLPNFFQYVSCNIMSSESCSEDFENVPQPCSCTGLCNEDSCSCGKNYGFGFLDSCVKTEYISSDAKPIIECSPVCSCNSNCPNRIVQHGISCKLQVFRTKNKGFGVQTLNVIEKFAFVCKYAGEIIDITEAKQRFHSQKICDPNYIFVLTEHCSNNKKLVTVIDPTITGNVGRFLNHSCSPNLFMLPVRTDSMIPKLCFFAKRNILPHEELCYDYGALNSFPEDNSFKNSSSPSLPPLNLTKCYCGDQNCLEYLPFCPNLFDESLDDT